MLATTERFVAMLLCKVCHAATVFKMIPDVRYIGGRLACKAVLHMVPRYKLTEADQDSVPSGSDSHRQTKSVRTR